jgi:chemotaxis protein methyltransferase WspC
MIFKRIYKYLEESIGLDIESIGSKGIDNSIRALMSEHHILTEDEFLLSLNNSSNLHYQLFEKIIVPETWFFRDSKPYEYLDLWLHQNKELYYDKTLQILSAPCSTGEEPYSIAISLIESGFPKELFQIDAIDISEVSINKAINGIYHKVSFRGNDKYFIDKYFTEIGMNRYQLEKDIRSLVNFRRDNILNLLTINPLERYHVIFFKNLLIYLTNDARLKAVRRIRQLLHPRGVLFTGHTETSYFLQHGFSMVKFPHSFALTLTDEEPKKPKDKVINTLQSKSNIKAIKRDLTKTKKNGVPKKEAPKKEEQVPEKVNEEKPLDKIKALADKGQFEQALELCMEYSQKNKTDENCYFLQGVIFEAINDKDNAIIQYNKVLYLSPYHIEALLHLSLLYESMGEEDQAKSIKDRLSRSMKRLGENGKQ